MLEVYIDGACEPINPGGTASYGVVVLRQDYTGLDSILDATVGKSKPDIRTKVWEDCGIVGSGPKMGNNVAEYAGLIAFLEWYKEQDFEEKATIHSDSNLVVQQMTGKFRVRKGLYIPYYEKASSLAFQIEGIEGNLFEFKWIPREDNQLADELSMKALNKVGIYRRK